MDDIDDIRALYERPGEEERLERHQLELDLTWRYLDAYLPASGHLLELGAATGRYTVGLARRGYRVTAMDLSESQTELSRQKLRDAGLGDRVRYLVGDARDLSPLAGETYDAALIMGPLYHLICEADRRLLLRQVHDLLRPGAPVFSAFISRLGILGDLMRDGPEWALRTDEVDSILERGYDPPELPRGRFRAYFARVEELAPLHEGVGFETLVVAGVEPAISADDASYNRLTGDLRRAWLDLLFRVSAEPALVASSRHMLYIGRRGVR